MALIKSISGIRGTIGGKPGDNLTPIDLVGFASAFGSWARKHSGSEAIVIGRDARISGHMVSQLVSQTLVGMGFRVVDLGLSTTPTVEMAVPAEKAAGGIILTASHNPGHWNALKLLNAKGEFLSAADGKALLEILGKQEFTFAPVDAMGAVEQKGNDYLQYHIGKILALPLVQPEAVAKRQFKVIVDAINSTGALALPPLLKALGCRVAVLNDDLSGRFAHNPEPLPEHLTGLIQAVEQGGADLGIAVDPDVDRLAFVCEDGRFFGEEYTLVAVADYVLKHQPGPTVSNLSSTRALRDVTARYDQSYHASAVGEVNVVEQMKAVGAVIGGEGNGGVIYPELHYGRDALAGVALFLSFMAESGKKATEIRSSYPDYFMTKGKIQLEEGLDLERLLAGVQEKYSDFPMNFSDGLKIDLDEGWIHLRKSNTEPIVRIYTEAATEKAANNLSGRIQEEIKAILK